MDPSPAYLEIPPPSPLPNWKKSALGVSKSVIVSLFTRELGLELYLTKGDTTVNTSLMCRQLIHARALGDGVANEPTQTQFHVSWKTVQKAANNNKPDVESVFPMSWKLLKMKPKCRLTTMSGIFCEDERLGSRGNKSFIERYYLPEKAPNGSGSWFRCIKKNQRTGTLEEIDVHCGRSPSIELPYSTYIFSLTDLGRVRMLDFRNTEELVLKSSLEERVRFTAATIDILTGKIFIAAGVGGIIKILYVVTYPPFAVLDVIYIKFRAQIEIFERIFCFSSQKYIEISTWDYVEKALELTKTLISDSQNVCSPPSGFYEKDLTTKPIMVARVSTQDCFMGILDAVWPPIFYSKLNDEIKIWNLESEDIIWRHSVSSVDEVSFDQFPDRTGRVLFRVNENYQVLRFKRSVELGQYEVHAEQPFNFDTDSPEIADVGVFQRQKRKCNSIPIPKAELSADIIGVCFFEELKLIGICTEKRNLLEVFLYDSQTLQMFKKLRPLKAWSKRRLKNPTARKDNVNKVILGVFYFNVVVSVYYGTGDPEVFVLPIM